MKGRRAAALALGAGTALVIAGCASSRKVTIEVTRAPALGEAGVPRVVRIGRIDIPRVADLDVAEETRRFLESDLRERTGVEVKLVDGASGGAEEGDVAEDGVLDLTGSGTYEETTLANPEATGDLTQPTLGTSGPPPVRPQARWLQAYRLRLHLELRAPGAAEAVWSESFTEEEPPRERGQRLFALYSVLEPVGAAVRGALGARKTEETRVLLPEGAAGGGR